MPSHRSRQVASRPVAEPKTEVVPAETVTEAVPDITAAEPVYGEPAAASIPDVTETEPVFGAPMTETIPDATAAEPVFGAPVAEAFPDATAAEPVFGEPAAEAIPEAPTEEPVPAEPAAGFMPQDVVLGPKTEFVPTEPVMEAVSQEPLADAVPTEPTAGFSPAEPAMEAASQEPLADAVPTEPTVEFNPAEPVMEAASQEPLTDAVSADAAADTVPADAAGEASLEEPKAETPKTSDLEDIVKSRQLTLEELEAKYQALLEQNKALDNAIKKGGGVPNKEAGAASAMNANVPGMPRAPKKSGSGAKTTSFWLKLAGILLFLIIIVLFAAAIIPSKEGSDSKTPFMEQIRSQDIKENTSPEIKEFFATYYDALASGNTTTLEEMFDDPSKAHITTEVSDIVEKYDVNKIHVTQGIDENDIVAFVANDIHFAGISTTAPSVDSFYLIYNEADNSLKICADMYTDQEILRFMNLVSKREPLHTVLDYTDKELKKKLAKDSDLNNVYTIMESMANNKGWSQETEEPKETAVQEETKETEKKKTETKTETKKEEKKANQKSDK